MKILFGFLILIGSIILHPKAEAYTYKPVKIKPLKMQTAYSYQRTNGYIRANGTYVNSYYRGVSNSVKYDNINYYNNVFGRKVYPNK